MNHLQRASMLAVAASLLFSAEVAVDQKRLDTIPALLASYVRQGKVAGAVTLVQRHGELLHLDAAGFTSLEQRSPMRTDSIFQIMSMSKPFAGVAIMMLVEQGKLSLDDKVETYLPAFQNLARLVDGRRVKPSQPVRIHHLMTHTSGMHNMPQGEMRKIHSRLDHTLAEAVESYAGETLDFDPGTRVQYSNPGIATLGRIVEVISGQPYERFLEALILKPLGMRDTFCFPPADKISRIALVYSHHDGKLVREGPDALGGDPALYRQGARYSGPEFGLFSTAQDLARFYQMMLQGGVWNGVRLLSPASVALMRTPQTEGVAREPFWHPGREFGLTWEIVQRPAAMLSLLPAGTYGHGGAFGTQGWIDPQRGLVLVFLVATDDEPEFFPRDPFLQIVSSSILH